MVKRILAVIDAETDPFLFGRIPKPFCWGFYDGKIYKYFWGNSLLDCTKMLLDYLDSREEPLVIYAHNGGKFDFLFFIEHLSGVIRIVNGRILEAKIGVHTIRDSYAILPIPLAKLGAGKKEIDYKLMEAGVREDHKDEILEYLEADCIALHDVVDAFLEEFGDILTVGGAAMRQLKRFHKFETLTGASDKFLRNYYFGGRCQCFETGVIDMPIQVYDINSAYPDAMDKVIHPIGSAFSIEKTIGPKTFFVCWEGKNENAVPIRTQDGLNFAAERGLFWSTIHEFNTALELGLIRPSRIVHVVDFEKSISFHEFVYHFYEARQLAAKTGNKFLEIFYKLILNSAYGKFAQSPEAFTDSIILPYGEIPDDNYNLAYRHDKYAIWEKPSLVKTYFNVGTAASITGAVRAVLMRGIASATRPLYCDTDSIFCAGMQGEKDDKKLGAWKHETFKVKGEIYTEGNQIAIAGKKLYALMNDDVCIKKASKGVNLNPLAIFAVARGDTVETRNDAPAFKLGASVTQKTAFAHQFIERKIRRTGLGV